MIRLAFVAAAVTAGLFASACATNDSAQRSEPPVPVELAPIELRYRSMGDGAHALPACAAISNIVVEDVREVPGVLGTWESEKSPGIQKPINANPDGRRWLTDALTHAARAAGAKVGQAGAGPVTLKLRQLELTEKRFEMADFRGRLIVDASVQSSAGFPCFSGTYDGSGRNYGNPENPENRLETLNKTVDEAVQHMLEDPGFRDALCGKCASP